jgi:hypothetical protein
MVLVEAHVNFWLPGAAQLSHSTYPLAAVNNVPAAVMASLDVITDCTARTWRDVPPAWIVSFCGALCWSMEAPAALPLSRRRECELLNLLLAMWRTRGHEPTLAGGRLSGCAPQNVQWLHCCTITYRATAKIQTISGHWKNQQTFTYM